MMKKEYMNPEMEIVELRMNVGILAGSKDAPVDDSDTQDNEDSLAPEFIF